MSGLESPAVQSIINRYCFTCIPAVVTDSPLLAVGQQMTFKTVEKQKEIPEVNAIVIIHFKETDGKTEGAKGM